jgi:cysteine-rich repeat protein
VSRLALLALLGASGCGARSGLLVRGPEAADGGADAGVDAGPDAGLDAGVLARCGNGALDPGEECDDGNRVDLDDCPTTCRRARCGDAFVQSGVEECDLGDRNADVPAYEVRQANGLVLRPQPVGRHAPSTTFYDYTSESAHTGFEAPQRASLFVYQDLGEGDRSIVYVFSQDDGGFNGSAEIDLTGLGGGDPVLLSDDPQPASGMPELVSSGGGAAHGSHHWFSNSDGGVIALACPLDVDVTLGATTFLTDWVWVEADGSLDPLDMEDSVEITCNVDPSPCRTSCRLPACGDDFLDPGEECDDGNTVDGDACPSDCDL